MLIHIISMEFNVALQKWAYFCFIFRNGENKDVDKMCKDYGKLFVVLYLVFCIGCFQLSMLYLVLCPYALKLKKVLLLSK